MTVTLAVLGMGEAGRAFAGGLSHTYRVVGFDPAGVPSVAGVPTTRSAGEAVDGADFVLAFAPAADGAAVLRSAAPACRADAVYADFATAGPQAKRDLEAIAVDSSLAFVDAAIMAPVRRGFGAVPVLLCGAGATPLAAVLTDAGGSAEVVPGPIGSAAARKLLRSILTKGLTALLIESLRTAANEGLGDWFYGHAEDFLVTLTAKELEGFLDGTSVHSDRRIDEMTAAAAMAAAGGSSHMATATVEVLRSVSAGAPVPRPGRRS